MMKMDIDDNEKKLTQSLAESWTLCAISTTYTIIQ